ncbi:hypothetical protein [Streptomyces anulatus]|uniref:hypothetical protein n=1 Tax=Streptomyces anulatus TaxID=1892 RepID=UPI00341C5C2B
MRRISYGSPLFRAALRAAVTTAPEVAAGGSVADDVPSYEEVQSLSHGLSGEIQNPWHGPGQPAPE